MFQYWIELLLTLWAAYSVRQIDKRITWGIYSGALCNLSFIAYWVVGGNYGFLLGDLLFTAMYAERIYRRW